MDAYAQESSHRRPSAAAYDRMPPIREDRLASSKSYPISIPGGKSKSRHDWVGSPMSDSDSLSGSMQSLALVNSNTSSVRRDSYSSYAGSERRPSAASYIDDDKNEIDGIYGAAIPRGSYGQREPYGSPRESRDRYSTPVARSDDKKDIDGIYGFTHGDSHRRPKEASYPSYKPSRSDSRNEKRDYVSGVYGQVLDQGRSSGHRSGGYSENSSGRHYR